MKQIFSILLAVLLLASLSAAAFAEAGDEESYDDWDWDNSLAVERPDIGLVLHIPADIGDAFALQGHIEFEYGEELSYGSGAYYTELGYFAMSDEEYEAMDELDDSRYLPLLTFVCVRNGCDMSAFQNAGLDINWENSWQMATVDNYTHYLFVGREDEYLPETFVEPYGSEYLSLLQPMVDIAFHADYSAPVSPDAKDLGKQLVFETTDLDGNPVNSADLFAANRITMLNMWETSCPHCVKELPDLAQIHQRLQSIGCGIVGLLYDSYDQENIDEAKQILADAGTPYITIQSPDNFDDLFTIQGFPISFFIDSSGQILGTPIEGAQVDRYEMAIQDLLNGGGQTESAPADAAPGDGGSLGGGKPFMAAVGTMKVANVFDSAPDTDTPYRIICVDENGAPVVGATVQFCSDMQCMIGKTDENGVAEFDEAPGNYTVHLLKVPEGFAKDKTEYKAPAVPGDLTIVVKAC